MCPQAETISVPSSEKLAKVQELCELSNPYRVGEAEKALFVEAMRQALGWHSGRSDFYRKLLAASSFTAQDLRTYEDCARVPFVLANFFKKHEVLSIDRKDVFSHFTSSGTTGQKSQVFFDRWSMRSGQRMVDWIFSHYGWVTPERPANYLLYSYETEADSKLGTAYTDHYLCKYSKPVNVFHALRLTGGGGHEFDCFGCIAQLQKYEEEGLPVRIFGFPAFLYFTLKRMRELKMRPLKLSPDSLVFLGGGWKGNADQAISKPELYSQVAEQLGIPDARIRDGFGSVEHAIPYIECEKHQFHVPVWSQAFARDIRSFELLPPGQKGFLHFVSPWITSMPAVSVLMGDLATVHAAGSCGCKAGTPYFVVHGRAGTSKNRSCAVAASELLKK